jgi:hypothetical protein
LELLAQSVQGFLESCLVATNGVAEAFEWDGVG